MPRVPLAVHTTVAAGDAVPVVLLHGFATSAAADFDGWPEALLRAGRSSHLIDLPGHGDSPAVASVADGATSCVVDAVAAAIESAGASVVDVVAYSLGARIAWELPARLPGRIRRLVLGGLSPAEPFAAIDVDELRRVAAGQPAPGNPLLGMLAAAVTAPGNDSDSLVNLIGGLGSEPFTPRAGVPSVPTLFVAGAADALSQGVEALVAAVPGARLTRVPGDHGGALASPEFRDAALEFLA